MAPLSDSWQPAAVMVAMITALIFLHVCIAWYEIMQNQGRGNQKKKNKKPVAPPLPAEYVAVLRGAERAPANGTQTCAVCMNKRASICFIPCGHQHLCDNCVKQWWRKAPLDDDWRCPTCRAEIENMVRPIC